MIAGATIPRARVATATVFAVHGAVAGSFATRIPWIRDRLDLSPGALGLALLVPALGALVAMPATGALVHRVSGRRGTRILIGGFCFALGLPAPPPGPAWVGPAPAGFRAPRG